MATIIIFMALINQRCNSVILQVESKLYYVISYLSFFIQLVLFIILIPPSSFFFLTLLLVILTQLNILLDSTLLLNLNHLVPFKVIFFVPPLLLLIMQQHDLFQLSLFIIQVILSNLHLLKRLHFFIIILIPLYILFLYFFQSF